MHFNCSYILYSLFILVRERCMLIDNSLGKIEKESFEDERSDGELLSLKPLIQTREAFSPQTPIETVAHAFHRSPWIDAFPVIEGKKPKGLITRGKLSGKLFSRFGHALYGNKVIQSLNLPEPMCIYIFEQLDDVITRAVERNTEDVYDDIVVVNKDGDYVGTVSVKKMVIKQSYALTQVFVQREVAKKKAREMEKINELKSQFLSNVTHELRAPVNTIVGLTELLDFASKTEDREKVTQYVQIIMNCAHNLKALINNVLDLTKIEAGKMEVIEESVDLNTMLSELAEATRILVRSKSVKVLTILPDDEKIISTDAIKLRQILTNLTNNAAKFTDSGSITLALYDLDSKIIIEIRDTGIGIKESDMKKLFKAFSQVSNAKVKQHEGTGLGLAITKYLCDLLNIEIRLKSIFGKGTICTLLFSKGTSNSAKTGMGR